MRDRFFRPADQDAHCKEEKSHRSSEGWFQFRYQRPDGQTHDRLVLLHHKSSNTVYASNLLWKIIKALQPGEGVGYHRLLSRSQAVLSRYGMVDTTTISRDDVPSPRSWTLHQESCLTRKYFEWNYQKSRHVSKTY